MRIGIDLRMSDPNYGIGRYSFELVRNILAIDPENSYILFVRNKKEVLSAFSNLPKQVELVEANFRHYSFEEQIKFPRVIKAQKLDLMHFLNFNVPLLYSEPFVVTIHDLIHHKLPGNKKRRILHRLAYKLVIRHAAKSSRRIVTVSNFSKREIIKTLEVSPNKISMIYEAATPVPVSDSDIAEVKQKFGLSKPYLIFVGVMERKKNLVNLARAFDILKDKYLLNIQLVLAGKQDPYYPEVTEEIKRIKYRNDLILTGVITDKEKFSLFKGAEAFVSSSLFEGFGLPGVEAMSLGVPLIVSNTEVFNEVYDNGAIYFDPHDPEDIARTISLLLNDEKYRSMVAGNSYQRAQNFSWKTAAEQTINVYNTSV